jgi:hypothetical protein
MRGHGIHVLMCGAMVVVALIFVLATGNPVALLPVISRVPMMFVMMQIMGGIGGRGDDKPE